MALSPNTAKFGAGTVLTPPLAPDELSSPKKAVLSETVGAAYGVSQRCYVDQGEGNEPI
jgi:hypothetical protein